MTQTLSDLSVTEGAAKALELILYGAYIEAQGPQRYGTPYTGTFEEYLTYVLGDEYSEDEITDLDEQSVWQHLKYEGGTGTHDGWTGKVEASYGGESQGDQYWMVVSLSDGITTRYFRKDGWYASYDGGYLDGDTSEVTPVQKMITFYE